MQRLSIRDLETDRSNGTQSNSTSGGATVLEVVPARRQGRWWILTIPFADWSVPAELPELVSYLHGQQEVGYGRQSYHHWQLFCITVRKTSLIQIKSVFTNSTHAELTRSEAAEEYCLKDDSAIPGTRFELGIKPFKRNDDRDWERVFELARNGDIMGIPASIRIQHYSTLRKIGADFASPQGVCRTIRVYWGRTGTGKSRRAWMEAGTDAFAKDPRSKFFYGYKGERKIVIDEFRGGIDIGHVLRWFDRYPVHVEYKGYSGPLVADEIWITSNLHPIAWYPDLDAESYNALMRRFEVVEEFTEVREFE